ncbi:YeeE/YedE thiosulfate transporter family protein [Sulfurimonas sp.]|jgi:uncharacterized membrane protein YedE/YeeE|uniref:YeeE/YedE thiosulfate transporter family protein n=1 Tax=Sulfurimonas sp. TaxID=2022749 RepID=UPI0025DA4F32|nr:YeeE/YedE thiosulfate transporter family protein [Sulfurimonas sp.]MBT5934831.1 YeeE/YedE family protein [Sulfurimonas sp.]
MQGKRLNWLYGGVLVGIILALAIFIVKPVGGSTQFSIVNGIIWDSVVSIVSETNSTTSGYTSDNSYLAKNNGSYAKAVANPMSYGLVFVLSIFIGGFISQITKGPSRSRDEGNAPTVWLNKFGNTSTFKRYIVTFIGGFFVIFGARLASGCTSGHMMSGMMQTSVSGYLFAFGVFVTGIPIALLFYAKKGK